MREWFSEEEDGARKKIETGEARKKRETGEEEKSEGEEEEEIKESIIQQLTALPEITIYIIIITITRTLPFSFFLKGRKEEERGMKERERGMKEKWKKGKEDQYNFCCLDRRSKRRDDERWGKKNQRKNRRVEKRFEDGVRRKKINIFGALKREESKSDFFLAPLSFSE